MKMTNEQKYILHLLKEFINQKGKGSCYAYKPVKPENILITFINQHRQKRTDTKLLVVVNDFETRLKIVNLLQKFNLSENITILTKTYINAKYKYDYYFTFIVGINEDFALIKHLTDESRFTFAILTEHIVGGFEYSLNSILPIIKSNIQFSDFAKDRMNFPVEEMHIPVQMSDDDIELSKRYDEYMATSMSIFGSFENADKCRIGDATLNISAGQFRYDLARENGWHERLDTTIEFNARIDELYNPNALYERANTLYNIIRERSRLLTDNTAKLPEIVNIIRKHPNDKIIIVSKRGEFANIVANYINDNTELLCGEYHDCIPEQYLKDENGKTIVYKSGENKGKPKLFKSKYLSTTSLNRFNSSDKELEINLLSIKNSSDNELKTAINVVIFTSSVCSTINEFINRFDGIDFKDNVLYSYVLYCANSAESVKLNSRQLTNNVKLIENDKLVQIDNENGAVYL